MRAQTMVEYGLLIATVAMLVLISTLLWGNVLSAWFEALVGRITTLT